jgi:hypothetical protein
VRESLSQWRKAGGLARELALEHLQALAGVLEQPVPQCVVGSRHQLLEAFGLRPRGFTSAGLGFLLLTLGQKGIDIGVVCQKDLGLAAPGVDDLGERDLYLPRLDDGRLGERPGSRPNARW